MTKDFEISDEQFIQDVLAGLAKARLKFPAPNPTIAALTEEVGELAQAALHIYERKSNDWRRLHDEAVQVAIMAMRMATKGDATIGAVPTLSNCK